MSLDPNIYIKAGGLVSPLGSSIDEAVINMFLSNSGLSKSDMFKGFSDYYTGYVEGLSVDNRFNDLLDLAISNILVNFSDLASSPDTIFVVSSSKGDISLLPSNPFQSLASEIHIRLKTVHKPLVISNACISGVLAINVAADLLRIKKYRHAIVLGIDTLSEFVLSGFNSLFALSPDRCKPYDESRKGINLGEAAGVVVLSVDKNSGTYKAKHLAGITKNDANHISGPSRTGEGLYLAVNACLELAGIDGNDLDYISSHGTSTLYNDEMESIAFDRLGLNNIPLNSFKAYVGHTLGASGVVETILGMKSMEQGRVAASLGCNVIGVSKNINVVQKVIDIEPQYFLKTGSGFGGCNAALIIESL
jgi:3-oxoacyl-[acyl-carrier-protein] synthase-1